MNIDRIQKRLNVERSKNSVNTDAFLKLNLDQTNYLIPTNEIDKIVNLADQFNTERQNCSFYRIIGTINPLVSNPLFNLSNTMFRNSSTWGAFNDPDFLS